jgi:hypothetical protein
VFPAPEEKSDRRSGKTERLPKAVGKISLIGLLNSLRTIGENGKFRGLCPHLGGVIELYSPSLMERMVV